MNLHTKMATLTTYCSCVTTHLWTYVLRRSTKVTEVRLIDCCFFFQIFDVLTIISITHTPGYWTGFYDIGYKMRQMKLWDDELPML